MSSKKQPTDAKNSSKNSKASSKSASKIHMECTPGPSGLATPLQPAKSGAAGHAHAVSEPKCSAVPAEHAKQKTDSSAEKKDSAPLDAVNERLNIIEDMLARVAEALPPSGSQAFAEEYWADYGGDEPATTAGEAEERELEAPPHGELPAGEVPGAGTLPVPATAADSKSFSETTEIPSFAVKFAVQTGVGRALDNELSRSATFLMSNKLEEKVMEETANKYPCPANCPLMDAPQVNQSIWDRASTTTRSRDLKLQRVQKALTKGLTAFVHTLDPSSMNENQQDALALLCTANFELNLLRRDLIKPDMNREFTHLCKPSNPVTKQLFGDELGKKVKDLQEQRKATAGVMRGSHAHGPKLGKSGPHYQYHPYRKMDDAERRQARAAGWYTSPTGGSQTRPFLGQRGGGWKRKLPPPALSRPPQSHRPPQKK